MHQAIETRRLRLHEMSLEFLRASLAGNRRQAETLLGPTLPGDWPADPGLLELRRRELEKDPTLVPWLTRVIELKSEACVVGVIGFHGPPGGDWLQELAPGGVEFGYTVFPRWRRQGLALEASRALMSWATQTAGVTRFALSMKRQNAASVAVAERLGFSKVGTWQHPVRGSEEVYRLDARAPIDRS